MGSMSAEHYELAHVVQGVTGVMKIAAGLRYADAILAAGYRKPRVVSTAAELDALAVGSVVYVTLSEGRGALCYQKGPAGSWWPAGGGKASAASLINPEATIVVLHEPEGER